MTYDKRKRYIGNSFSLCIRDIITGKMPLKCVKGIYSGTRITNFKELFSVIRGYKENCWEEFSNKEIMDAINGVFFGNKIFYQVRLDRKKYKVLREKWTSVKEFRGKKRGEKKLGTF